jgi:NAD(P)-dependent dehydrogenase (short-subunit alcohol dehydrogenase family)
MKQNTYTPISESQLAFTPQGSQLENRVVVISGSTGGLGTALSKACAMAGATVVLLGRNLQKLEALYDVLESIKLSSGENAHQPAIITLNQEVATEVDYQRISEMLIDEFGKIDALVHTAADLGVMTPVPAIAQSDWARVMSVNLTSARLLTNACLPLLEQSDNASVVYTLDDKSSAYWGAYGVSKAAVHQLMTIMVDESDTRLNDQGNARIAMNAIDPGPMRTPLRRKAFPGELETETEPPEAVLGVFLSLITRSEPSLNGVTLKRQPYT